VIAGVAPPGSHADEPPDKIVHGACATRAETVCTSAPGTDHSISTLSELAARIPKSSPAINRTPAARLLRDGEYITSPFVYVRENPRGRSIPASMPPGKRQDPFIKSSGAGSACRG
jgi:hypothetical protein